MFYEDEPVNDRVIALIADAGIDADMEVHTTGNVDVNETLYDPDDVILQALRDTADAEWPGVANLYEDRFGRVVWHGRFARFDPEGTAADIPGLWDFTRWKAATREDVTTGVAQIHEFSFNRPRARIINSYLAYPRADENGYWRSTRRSFPTLQKTGPDLHHRLRAARTRKHPTSSSRRTRPTPRTRARRSARCSGSGTSRTTQTPRRRCSR